MENANSLLLRVTEAELTEAAFFIECWLEQGLYLQYKLF